MKKLVKIVTTTMIIALAVILGTATQAKASTETLWDYESVKPTEVLDVDNAQYPETSMIFIFDGSQESMKFEIEKPSIIKAYYTVDVTDQTMKIIGTSWVSRDAAGIKIIGLPTKVTSFPASGVTFLDPGTYYLNHKFSVKQNNSSTGTMIGVALLVQPVETDENPYVSSIDYYNPLIIGKDTCGFLSNDAPNDYYGFIIDEYGLTTINFDFMSKGGTSVAKGMCTLYDANKRKIISKNFNTAGMKNNIMNSYLKPGKYYIMMSGTTAPTYIRIDHTRYDIECEKDNNKITKNDINITLSYDFETTEIYVAKGEISQANIKSSSVWNKNNCISVKDDKFTITENGTYTIRAKDVYNSYVLKTFTVKNIDKEPPVVTGVVNKASYKKTVTIKYTDVNFKSATLDGKKIAPGTKVKTEGKHVLIVKDDAGNTTKVQFTIKK